MKNNDSEQIDIDSIVEVRDIIKYALEDRSWRDVGDALELLNELLGYEHGEDEDEDEKKNHLEE